MNVTMSLNGIKKDLVTMYVDETTKAKLDLMKPEGNIRVAIPDEGLAVTLTGDNTVGFGSTATGADTDKFYGLIKSYSGRNTVGVQFTGFAVSVPTKAAISRGENKLLATNEGKLNTSATAKESRGYVTKASTTDDLFVDIQL